jgi:MarR family transcriptional regulator, organic hydroperoxide resistance regulator
LHNSILEKVSCDLLSIFPLVRRTTQKKCINPSQLNLITNITPLHFEIIRLLDGEGALRVATIGEKLHVSKAQMSQLLNKLVDLGLVERNRDDKDRRATNIGLTSRGKKIFRESENALIKSVEGSLSRLSENELEELSISLKKMQQILNKLSY